jgi:hypothetical protein
MTLVELFFRFAFADHLDERVPAGDDGANPFARRDPGRAGRRGRRSRCRGGLGIGFDEGPRSPVRAVILGRSLLRARRGRVERFDGRRSGREFDGPNTAGGERPGGLLRVG